MKKTNIMFVGKISKGECVKLVNEFRKNCDGPVTAHRFTTDSVCPYCFSECLSQAQPTALWISSKVRFKYTDLATRELITSGRWPELATATITFV